MEIIPNALNHRVKLSIIYLLLATGTIVATTLLYKGGLHLVSIEANQVTLRELPFVLTLSLLRMTVSFGFSLLLAFIMGILAAKTSWGERIILPLLDIFQSIPVIGFFPAAISFFIGVSNGHRLGVEAAACFLIFTSQAWNMAFSVYESVKSIPKDYEDATFGLGLSGSQILWRLYIPFSVPRLIYNSILSWSNGWFFLVACEIIAVGPVKYYLPGIGSFLSRAAEQDQISFVVWGLIALTILILLMDFILWRPLSEWAQRFIPEGSPTEIRKGRLSRRGANQIANIISAARLPFRRMMRAMTYPVQWLLEEVLSPLFWDLPAALAIGINRSIKEELIAPFYKRNPQFRKIVAATKMIFLWMILGVGMAWILNQLAILVAPPLPELVYQIPYALLSSTLRIVLALLISVAWILPVVYYSWNRPKLRQWLTTIAQVGASLPAVALFPLFILLTVKKFGGGMEIASILLLLMGMQWYLLFNCMGGAAGIHGETIDATRSLGLKGHLVWKRLVFPAIAPPLVTGAITAWGGGWNALVVSEYVVYKNQVLNVFGIGSLLNYAVFQSGDKRSIAICVASMVTWIILINSLVWRPLIRFTIERFRFET